MPAKSSLYDRDFYAWSVEQAALLREGRVAEADLENIAEELESMGEAEKREFVDSLTVLMLHLLRWRYQPSGRGDSWRLSIAEVRDEIADLLEDSPSLKANLDSAMASAYRDARREAAIETEMAEESFPSHAPWTFGEATDEGFWPG
jgi:predicted  nucleic acid-binding Zn-ribbon protein